MTDLAAEIERLLDARRPGATICPSDVARAVGDAGWRSLMDDVRSAAWQLADDGTVVITQHGQPVGRDARGPLRIGRPG